MSKLYVAPSPNLSVAWTEALFHLMERGVNEIAPAVITITEFDERSLPRQIPEIQEAIDSFNKGIDKQTIRTVANTIFPNALWRPDIRDNAQQLYARYERIWQAISRCPANNKGVYFRRLTAFRHTDDGEPVNQLDHIIETYLRENHRHSALQASIFDPMRDHTHNRQRGFPCLQQVAFGQSDGNLEVTGFYALQHHVAKAYGNYLGLCWLGRFMAQQMNLRLGQVSCIASSLKLPPSDGYTKQRLAPLRESLEYILEQHNVGAA